MCMQASVKLPSVKQEQRNFVQMNACIYLLRKIGAEQKMSQESEIAGPLTVWITRLQQKVNALEEASQLYEDRQILLKEIATCDTYWKKIYVRAKDFVFSTAQGPQIAHDLAHIQEQLTLIRSTLRKNEPWEPFTWEQWSPSL